MAMNYQNFASLGVNLNRQKYGPLDISNVFTSAADLKYYLTKGTFTEGVSEYWYKNANEKIVPYPYEGQVLATVIDGVVEVFVLALDAEGNFETREIAGKIEVDGTTIVKDADGKLSIVAPVNPDDKKTYNFAYANGVYSWVEVDTATAAGQAQAIQGLTDRTVALETAVGDATKGLVKDVADNKQAIADEAAAREAAIGKAAEGETAASGVYAAIADALEAAKAYADEQDADTVYDDTDVVARIADIEADYLTSADAYDDTELRDDIADIIDFIGDETTGLVKDIADNTAAISTEKTRAEAAEKALGERIDAIDFVDNNELTDAIKDFATTEYVNTELAKKAAQTDFEALQARVEAFLDNTGVATEAIDTLQDLINYINTHDDADISGILASIQAIENKLAGIDSTVATYVTAAIAALNIGDYAKAADLTDLAGRVATLEAKPFDTYATKTEVQDVDAKFASYTTTKDLNSLLADKADADSVVAEDTFETFKTANTTAISNAKDAAIAAAKTETETQIGALEDAVAETYATKTALTEAVEGIENDLLAYAKTEDVNKELAKKIENATIARSTETKAEGVTIDGTTLNIVVDAYSKEETLAKIDEKITSFTGGESAADVKNALDSYKETNNARVGAIETKNGEQDTAIANAQSKADKAESDAAKVAADLVTANLVIAENTRKIGVVDGKIDTVNETLTGEITKLQNADTTIKSDIINLQTTVSGEGGHASRITALEGRATNLETRDTELAALIQGNTDKFANYSTTTQMNAAIAAAVADADLSSYAKVTDVEAIYKAGASEGEAATGVLAAEIERAKAAEKANADAISAIVGADTGKTIRVIAAEETAKIVAGADTDYDTLKEIADFIKNDTTGAAAMSNNIAALKTTVGDAESGLVKAVADNADAIAAIVQPKASTEISVGTDGTLGIKEMNVNKLVQTEGDTLVLNGGDAGTKAAE